MQDTYKAFASGRIHLNSAQLAERLGLSVRQIERMRQDGTGPAFMRVGIRAVVYREQDVEAWEAARRFTSTSAETVANARRERVPA